jgi:hypothetical protein
MSTIQSQSSTGARDQVDSDQITWQDVCELGLDPAPAGLTEESELEPI